MDHVFSDDGLGGVVYEERRESQGTVSQTVYVREEPKRVKAAADFIMLCNATEPNVTGFCTLKMVMGVNE